MPVWPNSSSRRFCIFAFGVAVVFSGVLTAPAGAKPAEQTKSSAPSLTSWQLSNGINVFFAQTGKTTATSVELRVAAGSRFDPPGKAGLANLFATLLRSGTALQRPGALDLMIYNVGGDVNLSVGYDVTSLACTVPKVYFEKSLAFVSERLRGLMLLPAATEQALAYAKRELAQKQNDGWWRLGSILTQESIIQHPYRFPILGTAESLSAITAQDIRAFYDQRFVPGNALVVVAGDLSVDAVKTMVEKSFGAVPSAPTTEGTIWQEPDQTAYRVKQVPLEKTSVWLGAIHTVTPTLQDVVTLQLLGQGLAAHLRKKVPGEFETVSLSVQKDMSILVTTLKNSNEAGFLAIWQNAAKQLAKPLSTAELNMLKKKLAEPTQAVSDEPAALSSFLGNFWGITGKVVPPAEYLEQIDRITASQLAKFAAANLTTQKLTVVVTTGGENGSK